MQHSKIDLASLETLFRPRSIAVLGASTSAEKIGGRPVASILRNHYRGAVYPINSRADTVQGLPAYPSILDVPGHVDLAVCAVPGAAVKRVVTQCADKGVGSLIVFSSGFAEVGAGGARAQDEIAALAREAGMRMMGPNCMGMVNFTERAVASFHPSLSGDLEPGRIGLVSQSGAFGGLAYMLARARRQSLSFMLTTGNEADVDVADCAAFLAEDPGTDVILLYVEGCRDGPKLLEALERARARHKPVVALKLGRTESGAAAAASHTAALAGEDAVYDAVLRQLAVHRASSIEELFDVGRACVVGKLPRGDRVALITVSGGVGALMADDAEARGLDVAPMPAAVQSEIRRMLPYAGARNPVDVTGQILNDPTLLDRCVTLICESGEYGAVVAFQGSLGANPAYSDATRARWVEIARRYPETLFAVTSFAEPDYCAALEAEGVPVFEEPTHATRAVAALRGFARAFARRPIEPQVGPPAEIPAGALDEAQALTVLEQAGIRTPAFGVARSAGEAVALAEEAGYPVVAKILSPDILHKSDLGGVRVGLRDADEVADAFAAIMAAGARVAGAQIRGCLVAPVHDEGVEVILGVQRDPVFGPVVMFGLGGVFVEALGDVTFRVAPFDAAEARLMIREIRAFPLLTGLRGRPPCDIDGLAGTLSRLSVFAKSNERRIVSIDVNPYLVGEAGGVALDAALVAEP